MNYYQKPISEIFNELQSSEKGLSDREVLSRLQKYGQNKLQKLKTTPLIFKFFHQFTDLLIIILIVAALLALLIQEPGDALIIFIIVLVNAVIGFIQEYKAEKILSAFTRHIPSYAKVIREGKLKQIFTFQIVPGDILVLEPGDAVGADARLIEGYDLKTNDFSLTGESQPQEKKVYQINEDKTVTDMDNMVFMGTSIAEGNAKAIVTKTGMETEFGKIAQQSQEIKEEPTPLQKELLFTGKTISKIAVIVAVFMLLILHFLGRDVKESILFAIAAGAAVVPEGLPAAMSIALSMGAQRMLKQRALVKKLLHVESLGSVSVICTDKTGTLTTGEMTVIRTTQKLPDSHFLETAVLCNNASLTDGKSVGDSLEIALLKFTASKKQDVAKTRKENLRIFEIPFSSSRKMMTTVCKNKNGFWAYSKGACLEILDRCGLSQIEKDKIIKENDEMAKQGLRVLALAFKNLGQKKDFDKDRIEQDLNYLGLVALEDPPRQGVKEAVGVCKKAGIKVIMITGDYGLTALAIGKQIGLVSDKTEMITGSQMHRMDDQVLSEHLRKDVIFARIEPGQKLRIVKNLQEQNNVVAVTGDGVNDAPALVAADIGVAMGKIGTDVAKEAADMVLLDDHFATIIHAIAEGRRIFDNAKKIVLFVFSANSGELFTPLLGVLLGLPLPLLAIQIFAIDLGTDVFPSLALGLEKQEPKIMERPPRERTERMMNIKVLSRLIRTGLIMGTLGIVVYLVSLYEGGWRYGEFLSPSNALYHRATASVYAVLVLFQIGNAFLVRSEKFSIKKIGFWTNPWMLYASLISIFMLWAMMDFSPIQNVFKTDSPSPLAWFLILLFFFIFLVIEELGKKISFKSHQKEA